jgi:hypothetical protein
LDIWIEISEDNAAKLVLVLHEFVIGSIGLEKEDFLKSEINELQSFLVKHKNLEKNYDPAMKEQ